MALPWRGDRLAEPRGPKGRGRGAGGERARAWRIWMGPVGQQVVARFKLFILFRTCSRGRERRKKRRPGWGG